MTKDFDNLIENSKKKHCKEFKKTTIRSMSGFIKKKLI